MGFLDRLFNPTVQKIEARMIEVSENMAKTMAKDIAGQYIEEFQKAQEVKNPEDLAALEPKSFMYDPFFLMDQMGYKERVMSVTYDTLRLMTERNPIVAAVVNTRIAQVASFARLPETKYDVGFEIQMRDKEAAPTDADKNRIRELENMFLATGFPQVVDEEARDSFESFLAKYIRDSLTYDQAVFEVVKGRGQKPVAFYAIDSSTIRRASTPRVIRDIKQRHAMSNFQYSWDYLNNPTNKWSNPSGKPGSHIPTQNFVRNPEAFEDVIKEMGMSKDQARDIFAGDIIKYVQVLQGRVLNTYTEQEIGFGIRNPRTGLYYNGYGVGELEILISTITAHLWAEEYNKRFFSQGSAPKGMIHFEGGNITQEQITAFRRQWHAQVAGVWNAWKTPIISSPGKMNYQNLQMNNRQMEFTNWIEYLVKLICGVFLIDPAEINFDFRGGAGSQQAPLFMSGNEAKQKMSRDRGLKPLLRFCENEFNKNILWLIDDRFTIKFVGLDAKSEKEVQDLRVMEVKTFKTIDEVRAEYDLEALGEELGGDLILDPGYLNWRNQKEMAKQQEQMMQQQGGEEQGGPDYGMDFGQEGQGGEGSPGKGQPKQGQTEQNSAGAALDFGQEG